MAAGSRVHAWVTAFKTVRSCLTLGFQNLTVLYMSSTYVYYEGCGFESEPFEADNDDAAETHVLATFRSPSNPDFDGDEGGIVSIGHDEDGDEQRESVVTFDGTNMIPDPFGERRSYRGGLS